MSVLVRLMGASSVEVDGRIVDQGRFQRRSAAAVVKMPLGFQPRQRAELLHRELLRRAGRCAELVTVDPTDEQAYLGAAQGLLAAGDRAGERSGSSTYSGRRFGLS